MPTPRTVDASPNTRKGRFRAVLKVGPCPLPCLKYEYAIEAQVSVESVLYSLW